MFDLEKLIEQLENGDANARRAAAESLKQLGSEAAAARLSLVEALIDDCPQVQFAAASALEQIGICEESAFPIVSEIFDDEEARYCSVLGLRALGLYGDKALEMIRAWIKDPASDVSLTAVRFLKFIGVDPSVEISLLKERVKAESDGTVMEVILERIEALGRSAVAEALPYALERVNAGAGDVDIELATFLGRSRTAEAIEALDNLLLSERDRPKYVAIMGLVCAGGDHAQKTVPHLIALKQKHGTSFVGLEAGRLLERLGQ